LHFPNIISLASVRVDLNVSWDVNTRLEGSAGAEITNSASVGNDEITLGYKRARSNTLHEAWVVADSIGVTFDGPFFFFFVFRDVELITFATFIDRALRNLCSRLGI